MALIDSYDELGDSSLHIDRFGLSIGSVSVGLPLACTAEDVYRRYLDLLAIVHRGPCGRVTPADADVIVLSDATSADPAYVARRLAALQPG